MHGWGAAELEQFLPVLALMHKLTRLTLDKSPISELPAHVKEQLEEHFRGKDGHYFEIGESDDGGNAYLVTFKKSASTRITSGYNKGKVFDEAHVVTGVQPLGLVRKRGGEIRVGRPANDEGCALIVQEPGQARVVSAAYCPG